MVKSVFLVYLGWVLILMCLPSGIADGKEVEESGALEEDWGDGLKVLTIYKPDSCEYYAKGSDIIHYHYVGRLASDGSIFGKSFDYNSPYIVALGHSRIIAGMDRGLMGTCLWERRRISFPPHLGYGDRGVGTTIPPNSSLVFYIRLIKIERNGYVLGEDADVVSIWNSGLASYTDQNWQQAVDMMEEALRLYSHYKNQTLLCIRQCEEGSDLINLSSSKKTVLDNYSEIDPLTEQFVWYGLKGKCVRDCKNAHLQPKLRNPDPVVMREFSSYLPYSYLHYAYYQVEEFEAAARCCFTYLHYNPTDELALKSIIFYRYQLNLTESEFIYREPDVVSYQESYIQGKMAYQQEQWSEAMDAFENSLSIFKKALNDCYFLCEDVIYVNLTEPNMNAIKRSLLEEYRFTSDTMEFYELLATSIKEVLKCRNDCYDRRCQIQGRHIEDYFASHFNYLQYIYFQLRNVEKAIEAAATFLALDPSSDSMADNIRYYSNTFKLSSEDFVPNKEYVHIWENQEVNRRLLYFAEHGEMEKRLGRKGDSGEHVSTHEEL